MITNLSENLNFHYLQTLHSTVYPLPRIAFTSFSLKFGPNWTSKWPLFAPKCISLPSWLLEFDQFYQTAEIYSRRIRVTHAQSSLLDSFTPRELRLDTMKTICLQTGYSIKVWTFLSNLKTIFSKTQAFHPHVQWQRSFPESAREDLWGEHSSDDVGQGQRRSWVDGLKTGVSGWTVSM